MAVFSDLDDKARIPADRMAAESMALRLASARGVTVKVYQRTPDYLVTAAPDPGAGWSCVFVAHPGA
jgi:hypothetical protein